MATILTAGDLADKLGTDARTARKFLRSITPKDQQPGKGSRWGIKATEARSMPKKFNAWVADQEAKAAARAEKAAQAEEATDEAEEVDEEPTAEELEALEPTDEELADIEA
jgi:heterodisulfide reductase subunit A-like polyferredoxin